MSRVALVTGASTGIGAETARVLAKNHEVIVHYNRSQVAARQVAAEIEAGGGRAALVQADLTSEAGCLALANWVKAHYDHLDVLVNNAGGLVRRQAARELEWELLEEVFALNVFSVMKLSSLCIPLLEKGDYPCIINITSIAARHGAPSATPYGAAKGAVDSFTRGLAKELAPTIRVNAVAPGVVATPFHERYSTPERMQQWREQTPLRMIGEPIHIALTVDFLINNHFMTGETIDVNGGLWMR